MAKKAPEIGDYKYGFHDKDVSIFRSKRGLTKEIVEEISKMNFFTQELNHFAKELPKHILDKHYYRKHGKNAYYGQN